MSSDIEDLKREIDIVDVISDYLNLERVGSSYRTNCPFHPDRTPSFYVSPSRQIFKCFGCGVGGDAIKFVSLYENVSYIEAAKKIAKRFNIRFSVREESPHRSKILQALRVASEFYSSKLKDSEEALEYLKSRNIDSSTIKRFSLGYAPSSGELARLLKEEGLLEFYERTGNLQKLDENIYRDLFRGRLVIPIRDLQGRVVGFGGRSLSEGAGPKYINSPESEVFKKRSLLFGFYEGLNYLRDFKEAILVEGYFDVISLHQEGFRNAVAPLGTSFGREHARLLSRYVKKVYLLFDGDEAGRKAIRLAVPHLLSEDLDVYPVLLPDGLDPHDFVNIKGRRELKKLLEGSRELFEDMLEKIKEGKDRERAIRDFIYFASFVGDSVRTFSLLAELSKLTAIPVEILSSRLYKRKESKRTEDREEIPFHYRVFLKGLMELRPEIDLEELDLPLRVKELAQEILNENYYDVPEEVLDFRTEDLETVFWETVERLRIDIPEEEVTVSDPKEIVKERIKSHKGGFRGYALRKIRGRLAT